MNFNQSFNLNIQITYVNYLSILIKISNNLSYKILVTCVLINLIKLIVIY